MTCCRVKTYDLVKACCGFIVEPPSTGTLALFSRVVVIVLVGATGVFVVTTVVVMVLFVVAGGLV